MILSNLANRMIFSLSLLGLAVSFYLFYEYNVTTPVICPIGTGCDVVRASVYSHIFGISIPTLGIIFYLTMAAISVIHTHGSLTDLIRKFQILVGLAGVGFGVYLTYLEAFVIGAFCFWCITSFIISILILLSVILSNKQTGKVQSENRN